MHDAQRAVAVLDAVDHDAQRDEVIDLIELLVGALHLVVDAVDVLGPTGDLGGDPEAFELLLQDLGDVA